MCKLEKYKTYIGDWKAAGKPVRRMKMACCKHFIEVPVPFDPSEKWDSLMGCPHCGELVMKIVTSTSAVSRR